MRSRTKGLFHGIKAKMIRTGDPLLDMPLLPDVLASLRAESQPTEDALALMAKHMRYPLGFCGVPCPTCAYTQLVRRIAYAEITCPRVMRGMRIRPRLGPRDAEKDRAARVAIELGLRPELTDQYLCKLIADERVHRAGDTSKDALECVRALFDGRLPPGLAERITRLAAIQHMACQAKASRGRPVSPAMWEVLRSACLDAGLKRCGEKVLRSFNFERYGTVTYDVRMGGTYDARFNIAPTLGPIDARGLWSVNVKVTMPVSRPWYTQVYCKGLARQGDCLIVAPRTAWRIGPGLRASVMVDAE